MIGSKAQTIFLQNISNTENNGNMSQFLQPGASRPLYVWKLRGTNLSYLEFSLGWVVFADKGSICDASTRKGDAIYIHIDNLPTFWCGLSLDGTLEGGVGISWLYRSGVRKVYESKGGKDSREYPSFAYVGISRIRKPYCKIWLMGRHLVHGNPAGLGVSIWNNDNMQQKRGCLNVTIEIERVYVVGRTISVCA